MITKSPTFCPAPWTSLNIDQAGETSPCFHCVDMIGNNKKMTIQEIICLQGMTRTLPLTRCLKPFPGTPWWVCQRSCFPLRIWNLMVLGQQGWPRETSFKGINSVTWETQLRRLSYLPTNRKRARDTRILDQLKRILGTMIPFLLKMNRASNSWRSRHFLAKSSCR